MPTPPRRTMPERFFAKIDTWWKALGFLIGAIAVGVTIGTTMTGYIALPGSVRANTTEIRTITTRVAALEARSESSENEARRRSDAISQRLDRLECLVIAGRRATPIEECL